MGVDGEQPLGLLTYASIARPVVLLPVIALCSAYRRLRRTPAWLEAVWGFFSAYALVFIVSMLAIIATGVDDFSAFASVVATLNNLGPGLGVVADNFTSMNPVAKWILIANMLFGRLEVFTLLVLFTPTFWRE